MTKLEEKLDKLNYYIDRSDSGKKTFCYTKIFPRWVQIYIYYNSEIDKITYCKIEPYMPINDKKNLNYMIKALKKAYKTMQKDLKELKQCQN